MTEKYNEYSRPGQVLDYIPTLIKCYDSLNTDATNVKSPFRKVAPQLNELVPRVLSLEQAVEVESVIVKPVGSFSRPVMKVLHSAMTDDR